MTKMQRPSIRSLYAFWLLSALLCADARGAELSVADTTLAAGTVGEVVVSGVLTSEITFGLTILVELVPQVPHQVYLTYLQQSDVLLLFQPQTTSQIPAKFFEYLQAGKTILALTPPNGATGNLVQSEGLGWVCDATDTEGIQHTLEALYHDFTVGTLQPTLSASGYQKYDMRYLTHRLASCFDRLV